MQTYLINTPSSKAVACNYIRSLPTPKPLYKVIIKEVKDTRTIKQNHVMWSVLTDLAKQVKWHGLDLSKEDWKEMITAGLKREQRIAPGIGGGFVVLGSRTSKMSIQEMIDVIDFAHAFGNEHGVKWSKTSLGG